MMLQRIRSLEQDVARHQRAMKWLLISLGFYFTMESIVATLRIWELVQK